VIDEGRNAHDPGGSRGDSDRRMLYTVGGRL
jgi:hypothetical protein